VTSAGLPARDDRVAFEARGLTKIYDMGAVQVHGLRKAMYSDAWGGLPAKDFLTRLDPRLADLRGHP
jgi:hypothetical protein